MCGIVGYVGPAPASTRGADIVMHGLKRLEYRGYDSAGIAVVGSADGQLQVRKKAGKLDNLIAELAARPLAGGTSAIGHTRWATHGVPSDANAHPHVSADGKLALIHNGIIENFAALRTELQLEGITLQSETDTEVAAHLLARAYDTCGDLTEAMRLVSARLSGAFTLLAIHVDVPGVIVGARRNSPLVIGQGDGENFLGSDVAAFIAETNRALEVDDDQIVTITADDIRVCDTEGQPVIPRAYTVDWDASAAVKGGFGTFMEKEIHDQPAAVADTLLGRLDDDGHLRLDELRIDEAVLRAVDKIIVIACGTAAYAGHVAKYAIEHWCRIPVEVELAHEFRYRDPIVNEKTLVVAISQSGETMDTLMAVRHAREQGAKVLGILNTHGATIAREADAVLYTHAGPEVAVASTKAFLAQITACYILGLYLAQLRGNMFADEIGAELDLLGQMPAKIQQVIDAEDDIIRVAKQMVDTSSVLFLGRHVGFPVALEGALKL
ncbi:MAG: glutamine--fructose-6-phosphate transaminase (isomerizing), partial [Bowdeniella nasicola]|nr:glutamine--fructose-6-phosphate transaminase (isomerizing) [Bowdeniella nasicola]